MNTFPVRINTLNFETSSNFKSEELLLNYSRRLTLCGFNDTSEST